MERISSWTAVGHAGNPMTHLVTFRTDASLQIGTGHVMRCLTLADALAARGTQCQFICRAHEGNLIEFICGKGYEVHSLPAGAIAGESSTGFNAYAPDLTHSHWLGATQGQDAEACASILATQHPDWLIVDHYGLDACWEHSLAPHYRKLMVIDDLADRPHSCDLLLDQNLGRKPQDYGALVPAHCQLLIGPHFALLRPEFSAVRPYSLQRRDAQPTLRHLLITMGGVDQPNATGHVLQALKTCFLPQESRITVVMGLTAPWLQDVRELAAQMPWPTEVVINVNNMAQRMADSDLAIGAAGSTSWERSCLGLPTLIVVLAKNQQSGAQALEAEHAARLIGSVSDIAKQLPLAIAELVDSKRQSQMSLAARAISNGLGVENVLNEIGVADA